MSDEKFKYEIRLKNEPGTNIVEADDFEETRDHYILRKGNRVVISVRKAVIDIFQQIE